MVTEGPLAGKRVLVLEPVTGFRFLDLPAEIRNIIYSYLLEEDKEIQIRSYKPNGCKRRPVSGDFSPGTYMSHHGLTWDKLTGKWLGQPWSAYALLLVCKHMLEETATMAYGTNKFWPRTMRDADIWLSAIGSMRRYIRHIELPHESHRSSRAAAVFRRLQDATDLRDLFIKHSAVCLTCRNARNRISSVQEITTHVEPLLKKMLRQSGHAENKDDYIRSLCGVVKIEELKSKPECYSCNIGRPADCLYFSKCGTVCKESMAHCEVLEDEIFYALHDVLTQQK